MGERAPACALGVANEWVSRPYVCLCVPLPPPPRDFWVCRKRAACVCYFHPLRADDVSGVDMWALREMIDDMLCTFHPFHFEAARAIMSLGESLRFPAFVFMAEVRGVGSRIWCCAERARGTGAEGNCCRYSCNFIEAWGCCCAWMGASVNALPACSDAWLKSWSSGRTTVVPTTRPSSLTLSSWIRPTPVDPPLRKP